jgi:hypothetical protein
MSAADFQPWWSKNLSRRPAALRPLSGRDAGARKGA